MIVLSKIKEQSAAAENKKLKQENAVLKMLLAKYHNAVVSAQPCEMCADRETFLCLGCKHAFYGVKLNWNFPVAAEVEKVVNGG